MTYLTPIAPMAKLPPELSQSLPIVETFHSIQGEGAWTGTNAFFIRLAGCDVGCPWCDTKHSWNPKRHPQRNLGDLVAAAKAANPHIVVITGGEPLMHDLSALTEQLKAAGLQVHLETSGSHSFSGAFDWITFSPKRFKPPHSSIYSQVSELKVVIADESDLEWAEQQAAKLSPSVVKLLQPEWGTPSSRAIVFSYVLKHSEWRISLQTHKFLGVQ
ncbi:MAG: 7-carboxy-7-deazaguanine synthase QueE [Pseudanabaenales cyanobacterium]|nr:7-carboxy-7-deazaguanine synthase QueE [Pseudanabaenales cyanobacterium]